MLDTLQFFVAAFVLLACGLLGCFLLFALLVSLCWAGIKLGAALGIWSR